MCLPLVMLFFSYSQLSLPTYLGPNKFLFFIHIHIHVNKYWKKILRKIKVLGRSYSFPLWSWHTGLMLEWFFTGATSELAPICRIREFIIAGMLLSWEKFQRRKLEKEEKEQKLRAKERHRAFSFHSGHQVELFLIFGVKVSCKIFTHIKRSYPLTVVGIPRLFPRWPL